MMTLKVRPQSGAATGLALAMALAVQSAGASERTGAADTNTADTALARNSADTAQDPAEAAPAQPAFGEIIVTAQRRQERLQDVPLAISAFTGEALQEQGVITTRDLTIVTPSLNFTQSSFSPQPTIRGIGTRGVSASEESVVPVYIDGVYQSFIGNAVFELNSIERIEVLRGPQTALYGRNSMGGAINIITRAPSAEPYMKASVSVGSFDQVIAKGYVSMGTETVQLGIGGLVRDESGYIDDLAFGGKVGWSRSTDLRAKLRLTPTDALEFILAGSTSTHDDTLSSRAQPYRDNTVARRISPGTYVSLKPQQTDSTGGELNQTQDTASLTAKADLGGVEVTSITGYDDSFLFTYADIDAAALDVSSLPTTYLSESVVQELYAVSDNGSAFQWIVGGTYFWRDGGNDSQILSGPNPVSDTTGNQITNAWAAYAQGTYQFTDALSVILAGRYTTEKKHHNYRNNLTGETLSDTRRFNDFSPSGSIRYEFSPDANIYVRAGKGFKSGLYATTAPSYTIDPDTGARVTSSVEPETAWQYEVGTKFALASRVRTNLAAFYTDYSNIQVNIRPNNTSRLQNAGAAEMYGIEGEIFAEPVDNLNMRLGFMKLWGEFTEFDDAIGYRPRLDASGNPVGGNDLYVFDAKGNTIIRTPLFTLSGAVNYTADLANGGAMNFSLNAFHAGKEYRDADNRVTVPAYTVLNSEIGYRFPGSDMKLSLWARNLLDETYNLYILTGGTADSTVYAPPRTVGVRLDIEFGG